MQKRGVRVRSGVGGQGGFEPRIALIVKMKKKSGGGQAWGWGGQCSCEPRFFFFLFSLMSLCPFQDYFTHRDEPIDRWAKRENPGKTT